MARSIKSKNHEFMELRQCGTHDLKLPVLGIGSWAFGGGEYWGPCHQTEVDELVRYAVERGCNFFDTAELYYNGGSETSLGLALKGLERAKVLIASKISPSNTEPGKLVEHCEASLRRLQTDYIDLYMVHWPITPHSIRQFTKEPMATPSVSEAFATLMRLRRAGKIRHIGVSNFGRAKLDEALATGAPIVINELPYSLLTRAIELDIMPYCQSRGVGVLGYMSLLQGVLGDVWATLDDVPVWQRRTRHFDSRRTPQCRHGLPGAEAETSAALEAIRALAHSHGLSTPELALKWAMAGKGITSSLCGCRTVGKLAANIKAAEEPISPALREKLNDLTQPLMDKLGPSFDYWQNEADDRTQ
jgi:aryl-alcohol dehydrogenase-like predicted oxidoreductase